MQHHRVVWGVGLIGLLVGCASTGVAPAPVATTPSVSPTHSPTTDSSPVSAPSVVPSEAAPMAGATCDPATAPFRLSTFGYPDERVLAGSDTILLMRCGEQYLQQIGQAPVPLRIPATDWLMGWLAPDGSSAIGMGADGLIFRRRPPVSSEELIKATKGHGLKMSAGGRLAAYMVPPVGQPTDSPVLHLMRLDTGEVRISGEATQVLSWSPDGQKVLLMKPLSSLNTGGLAWASWDDPTVRFIGDEIPAHVSVRDSVNWTGDSQHVVIISQDTRIPGRTAGLVMFRLDGTIVARKGLVDPAGEPLLAYGPTDAQAGNPFIAGYYGLLDPSTGVVSPLPADAVPRWSSRPGELLRWRQGPDGPTLDTVKAVP